MVMETFGHESVNTLLLRMAHIVLVKDAHMILLIIYIHKIHTLYLHVQ